MYFPIFKLNSWGKRSAEAAGDLFSGYFGGTPSRAGACASPLSRILWLLSCRDKKVTPRGTGTIEFHKENRF